MKINRMKYLLPVAAIMLGLSSCNEEEEYFELESPADMMQISADKSEIVLDQFDPDATAVTFKWGDPSDRGEGTSLSYKFVLVDDANDENRSQPLDLPLSARKQSFTNRELNELLKGWGYTAASDVLVMGKIIASVDADRYMKPEVSSATVQIRPYAGNMYLYYVSESGAVSPKEMIPSTEEGLFSWEGLLQPGKFWFSASQAGVPALMQGSDGKLTVVSDNVESGAPFEVAQPSFCKVELDCRPESRHADITIEVSYKCFMSLDGEVSEIAECLDGSGCFTWTGYMAAGSRFEFSGDAENAVPYVLSDYKEGMMLAQRDGNGFTISKEGNYVITVNAKTGTIIVMDICEMPGGWLSVAGDCFQTGQGIVVWSWENRKLTMTDPINHPHILTYTVTMKDSYTKGFKIMTQNRFAKEYVPAVNGEDNSGTWCDMFTKGGSYKDAYWKPSCNGEVTIYVDTHSLKVKTDAPGNYD